MGEGCALSRHDEDEAREAFRTRLERHRRRHENDVEVEWRLDAPLDSLAVEIVFLCTPSAKHLAELEEFIVSWHRIGVLGGFEGTVHNAKLAGLKADDPTRYEAMLDVGTAPEAAVEVFLRGLRGLKAGGLDIERVVLGWDP